MESQYIHLKTLRNKCYKLCVKNVVSLECINLIHNKLKQMQQPTLSDSGTILLNDMNELIQMFLKTKYDDTKYITPKLEDLTLNFPFNECTDFTILEQLAEYLEIGMFRQIIKINGHINSSNVQSKYDAFTPNNKLEILTEITENPDENDYELFQSVGKPNLLKDVQKQLKEYKTQNKIIKNKLIRVLALLLTTNKEIGENPFGGLTVSKTTLNCIDDSSTEIIDIITMIDKDTEKDERFDVNRSKIIDEQIIVNTSMELEKRMSRNI